MCGRYGRRSDKQKIADAFHVKNSIADVDFMPNDDITPGTMQPVVFSNDEGERDIELMYWGFTFPKRFTFNTRSDSILKPGLWKNSFEDRRCIVPADSFFEWKRLHKKNNPKYEITVPGRAPFALAGIWSMWKNKAGDSLPTVSVITSEPNEAMAEVHDRQPVILEPRDYAEWLSSSARPPVHLLRILPADEMKIELIQAHSMQLPLNSA
jgi:putative SOS response-associated peptidase YedK